MGQHPLGDRPLRFALQPAFHHLDVETAKLVPGEIVKHPGGVGVAIFGQGVGHAFGDGRQAAQNPCVFDEKLVVGRPCPAVKPSRFIIANREAFQSLLQKFRASSKRSETTAPRGRALSLGLFGPLRGKFLAAFLAFELRLDAVVLRLLHQLAAMRALELDRHADILRLGREIRDAEPQRIGPEFLHHVERIDAVPLRFRHPFAVAVQNFRMDEHLVERNFADVVQPGQHHPRHPKRDDIAAGDQHVRRIVVFQFLRLLRPAQRRMRPKSGTEPGVENVVLLVT